MPPSIGEPPAVPSDVISRPCSSNCALFRSSRSPKSPTIALDTLGASLIKNAVRLVVVTSTPVSAYEKI